VTSTRLDPCGCKPVSLAGWPKFPHKQLLIQLIAAKSSHNAYPTTICASNWEPIGHNRHTFDSAYAVRLSFELRTPKLGVNDAWSEETIVSFLATLQLVENSPGQDQARACQAAP